MTTPSPTFDASRLEQTLLQFCRNDHAKITVLTGAGISAESGIPTFRGPEGYWTVGSKVYHPQEMATHAMFLQTPEEVWKWYLYRRGVCGRARPNAGHLAIVELEHLFGDRFNLVTQNVDNLHLAAGNTAERTHQIHGNIFKARCAEACTDEIFSLPLGIHDKTAGESLSEDEKRLLICRNCGAMLRPHVLWFDEAYNETHYRYHTVIDIADKTDLLLIIGTSGATNLPNQVVNRVFHLGKPIIEINIEKSPFSRAAEQSPEGGFIQAKSGSVLPGMAAVFQQGLKHGGHGAV